MFITIAPAGIICSLPGRMLSDVDPWWTIIIGVILILVALDMLGIKACSIREGEWLPKEGAPWKSLDTNSHQIIAILSDDLLERFHGLPLLDLKECKIKETPDLTIDSVKYKMDLLPPALILARYLAAEQAELKRLEEEADTAAQALADIEIEAKKRERDAPNRARQEGAN